MDDTDEATREALVASCMAAAANLIDARDTIAQALGYAVLLDANAQVELTASLHQVAAVLSVVSAYVPPAEEDED